MARGFLSESLPVYTTMNCAYNSKQGGTANIHTIQDYNRALMEELKMAWCRTLVRGSVLAFLGKIQVTIVKKLTRFGNNE